MGVDFCEIGGFPCRALFRRTPSQKNRIIDAKSFFIYYAHRYSPCYCFRVICFFVMVAGLGLVALAAFSLCLLVSDGS